MRASRTAEYVAFYRALEHEERGRTPLFRDPYALHLLPPTLRRAVELARSRPLRWVIERYADYRAPGARSSAIGRTRFIDDEVAAAVADGCAQLVILGAGYDCRAHRLPALEPVRVFEVDQPATQQLKRSRIASSRPRADVEYVAVDFARDDLGESLASAGWSSERPTLFLWEGVTNYLSDAAVAAVLALVGRTAAKSRIVFTYIHRAVIDDAKSFYAAERLVKNVARLGEPWTFGIDPRELASFVARFGLVLERDLGADEYRARYGVESDGYAFYRVAVARVGAEPQP